MWIDIEGALVNLDNVSIVIKDEGTKKIRFITNDREEVVSIPYRNEKDLVESYSKIIKIVGALKI